MKIIITHPRSGSHLAGSLHNCEPFAAVRKEAPPYPPEYIIRRIKTGKSLWFHYPYSQRLAEFLADFEATKYVLLRDPRDIIISIAHRVEKVPQSIVNYKYGDKRINGYPFAKRVDILLDIMYGPFCDFDRWRRYAGLEPLYYSDLVANPDASKHTEQLERGIVGAYQEGMTEAQISRAGNEYKYLIRYWSK